MWHVGQSLKTSRLKPRTPLATVCLVMGLESSLLPPLSVSSLQAGPVCVFISDPQDIIVLLLFQSHGACFPPHPPGPQHNLPRSCLPLPSLSRTPDTSVGLSSCYVCPTLLMTPCCLQNKVKFFWVLKPSPMWTRATFSALPSITPITNHPPQTPRPNCPCPFLLP